MPIVRGPSPHDNYTVTANAIINDERISYKALGILMYLLSKPPGWKVTEGALAYGNREGATAIGSAFDELIAAGYVVRKRVNAGEGKFSWTTIVYGEPQPLMENPLMDNPLSIVSNEVVSNTPYEKQETLYPELMWEAPITGVKATTYPVKEEGLKKVSPGVKQSGKDTQHDYTQKEKPKHTQLVSAYFNALESLGRMVDRTTFPRYVKTAKVLADIGYTPKHVHEKTVEMGSQPFWKDKGLPIERVADALMVAPPQPEQPQYSYRVTSVEDDPFTAARNQRMKELENDDAI